MTQPEMEGQAERRGPQVATSLSAEIGFGNPGTNVSMVINIPSDGASITVYGDSGTQASTNLNGGPVSRPANGQVSTSGTYDRENADYAIRVTMTEGGRSQTFFTWLTSVHPGYTDNNVTIPVVNIG